MCSDGAVERRSLAAVLLRRLVDRNSDLWRSVSAATRSGSAAGLLHALTHEPDNSVRRKVAHAVAEAAASALVEGGSGWPELVPAVFALARSSDAGAREVALFALQQVVEYTAGEALPAAGGGVGGALGGFLDAALRDAAPGVRCAALGAVSAVITNCDDDAAREQFKALVPGMVAALGASFAVPGDEERAQEALKVLIEVVSLQPHFFRAHLDVACTAMLQIINHGSLEEACVRGRGGEGGGGGESGAAPFTPSPRPQHAQAGPRVPALPGRECGRDAAQDPQARGRGAAPRAVVPVHRRGQRRGVGARGRRA